MFSSRNPLAYVILLGYIVLLYWPAFDTHYFAADESIYWISAQRLAEGGRQYVDTWDHKPPLIIWFYTLFQWLFGTYAVLSMRVFACIYVYSTCLLLSHLFNHYRFGPAPTLLPAYILATILCTPWYALEFTAELFLLLPMLGACFLLTRQVIDEQHDWRNLAGIGMLLGTCLCIKYQAILLIGGLLLAWLLMTSPRLQDLTTFTLGFLLNLLIWFEILYFSQSLSAFWDIGFLYNLDYIRQDDPPWEDYSWWRLLEYLKVWGVFILTGGLGFFAYRFQFFKSVIRQRRMESILSIWLFAGLASIFLGGQRFYLHYFLLVAPPLAFYSAYFFTQRARPWMQKLGLAAALMFPLAAFGVYWFCVQPERLTWLQEETYIGRHIKSDGWMAAMRDQLNPTEEEQALLQVFSTLPMHKGIWIADYQPALYMRLNQPCRSKYTNFAMAYYKMGWFERPGARPAAPIYSSLETPSEVYQAFQSEQPDVIIDPRHFFRSLKSCIPNLLEVYTYREVAGLPLYVRSPATKHQSAERQATDLLSGQASQQTP